MAKKRNNNNIGGNGADTASNLFTGLLTCPLCDDRYTYQSGVGGKLDEITGKRARTYAVRCRNTECKESAGWSYPLFEKVFFTFIRGVDFSEIFSNVSDSTKIQNKIEANEGRLLTLDDEIKRAVSLMIKFSDMSEVEQQLNELKNEREEVLQLIEDLKVSKNDVKSLDTSVQYSSELTLEQRQAIRRKLPTFIDDVKIYAKKGCGTGSKDKGFKVIWKNGKKTVWQYLDKDVCVMNLEDGLKLTDQIYKVCVETGAYEKLSFDQIANLKGEVSLNQIVEACKKAGLSEGKISKMVKVLA